MVTAAALQTGHVYSYESVDGKMIAAEYVHSFQANDRTLHQFVCDRDPFPLMVLDDEGLMRYLADDGKFTKADIGFKLFLVLPRGLRAVC